MGCCVPPSRKLVPLRPSRTARTASMLIHSSVRIGSSAPRTSSGFRQCQAAVPQCIRLIGDSGGTSCLSEWPRNARSNCQYSLESPLPCSDSVPGRCLSSLTCRAVFSWGCLCQKRLAIMLSEVFKLQCCFSSQISISAFHGLSCTISDGDGGWS